jgi:hypothetical protein
MIAEGRWGRGLVASGVGICGMRAERNVEDGVGRRDGTQTEACATGSRATLGGAKTLVRQKCHGKFSRGTECGLLES